MGNSCTSIMDGCFQMLGWFLKVGSSLTKPLTNPLTSPLLVPKLLILLIWQRAENPCVGGSIPPLATSKYNVQLIILLLLLDFVSIWASIFSDGKSLQGCHLSFLTSSSEMRFFGFHVFTFHSFLIRQFMSNRYLSGRMGWSNLTTSLTRNIQLR